MHMVQKKKIGSTVMAKASVFSESATGRQGRTPASDCAQGSEGHKLKSKQSPETTGRKTGHLEVPISTPGLAPQKSKMRG
jgi:hypothetical protein